MSYDLDTLNHQFADDSTGLIAWALQQPGNALVTTNFGAFSPVLLHMVTRIAPNIPVLWVDHGYATPANYQFADEVTRLLNLNLKIYHPQRSRAHREAVEGASPGLDQPEQLAAFTQEVKLEPFARATRELAPQRWLTAVRADQTAERATMKPLSVGKDGVLKIAPLLKWNSKTLHEYLKQHGLPNNFDYYDPTKLETHRECGLHTT